LKLPPTSKGAKYDVKQDPAVDLFPSQFSDLVVYLLFTTGTLGVLLESTSVIISLGNAEVVALLLEREVIESILSA
jgi:hypothetical protein